LVGILGSFLYWLGGCLKVSKAVTFTHLSAVDLLEPT